MANAFVLKNCYVRIDGVDLSDHMQQVEVPMTNEDVDVTAMGAGGRQHLAGLRDDHFTFTAFSDFASGKIHQTINPKFVSGGTVEVLVAASGSTLGTSNPGFYGYCPVLTYTPIGGNVGDAAMTPLELPVNGTITVATS